MVIRAEGLSRNRYYENIIWEDYSIHVFIDSFISCKYHSDSLTGVTDVSCLTVGCFHVGNRCAFLLELPANCLEKEQEIKARWCEIGKC